MKFDTVVAQHHPMQPESRVFHRQRPLTVLKCAGEQRDCLRRARTEHDVLRVGLHAAGAPQIVCDRGARGRKPLRVNVTERVPTDLGQPLPQRPQPRVAGEAADLR